MLPHPCLLVNQHMIQAAKENIAAHAWAAETCHHLKLDADKLDAMQLPKFETAWWQEAKKKPWKDIYPEEMQHTYYVPRPATELAWKSALVYQLGGAFLFLGLVLYVPDLRRLFCFSALGPMDLAISLAGGVVSVAWFELLKVILARWHSLSIPHLDHFPSGNIFPSIPLGWHSAQ